ncbi:hypothetical protein [Sphingomonas sp. dw_22]|uniref:hypothetical protein n=1 Tax=Sphingomonas sp. dw_22 TaxID=2721175 RepID=UPI001BD328A8|nr:hypothetical protein [Sphingomonas sp. dw_22]
MDWNAEVIKAAAGSPLGVLALMVMGLSGLALTFFRSADARTKLIVFVLLLAGVAAFAIAVMMQPREPRPEPAPSATAPLPLPSASSSVQPASCRARDNGLERWGKTEPITVDSG